MLVGFASQVCHFQHPVIIYWNNYTKIN